MSHSAETTALKPSIWQQRFWANTGSSYVNLVVRLAAGLLIFRLMFGAFSPVDFGFWTVLWSILGFGTLVDFGFGVTIQRATARYLAGEVGVEHLNRLAATVFAMLMGFGGLLFLGAMLVRERVLGGMDLPLDGMGMYQAAYRDFFIGLIPFMPLGMIPEVLRGLHRSAIINWLGALTSLLAIGLVSLALHLGWDLLGILRLVVFLQLLPHLISTIAVHRLVPGFSLAPRWWSRSALFDQFTFSMSSYVISCSNVVLNALDNLLITAFYGLLMVPSYVAGGKVADLLSQTVKQLYGALPAAVAEMHARGDRAQVRAVLVMGYRLTWVVGTPLYVLGMIHLDLLLRILTGMKEATPLSHTVGALLLTSIWASAVVGGCGRRLLLLCDHHRAMMLIACGHLISGLLLGAGLGWWLGPWGVALGTLLAGVLAGSLPVIPLVLREAGLTLREAAGILLADVLTFGLAFAVPTLACAWWWPTDATTGIPGLLARGLLCIAPMGLFARRLRTMSR
jgi:O-antigen/teichoic acid export membrane protein